MQCNKWTLIGVGAVVCVLVVVVTYFAWPSGDLKTSVAVEGDDNVVKTSEKSEVSLLHIKQTCLKIWKPRGSFSDTIMI